MNADQERRLIAQVRRCYERIPFYRDRWPAETSTITSVAEFQALPFITKQDLLGDIESMYRDRVASPGSQVAALHLTSGTSGLGQELHPLTAFDNEVLCASWMHRLDAAGVRRGDSIAFTFPVGLQAGGLLGFRVAERFGLIPLFLAPYSTEKRVEYLLKVQPTALVITPSYLTRITTLMRAAGHIRSPFPMRGLFVSGESHTMQWAEEIGDWWNCRIFEWYSCMQAGTAVAYSCETGVVDRGERGHLHIDETRSFLEVLDPDTLMPVAPGADGEVVITSLFREGFPVVRFRTGDRLRLHATMCSCGREGRSFVAGSASRYDDMIKIRGQNVWPAAVDEILLGGGGVEEYQALVYVDELGNEQVEIRLEWTPGKEPSADRLEAVLGDLAHEIRERVNVRVRLVAVPQLTLPRYEFKVRRWTDERKGEDGSVVRYTEPTG